MRQIPEIINGRQIFYMDLDCGLQVFEDFPLKNWVLVVVADDLGHPLLNVFSELCIDKDVIYVCAAGEVASELDDLFDGIMVLRGIYKEYKPSWHRTEEDVLMTTWHSSTEDAFWFATTLARYDEIQIDTVLVANFTFHKLFEPISQLASAINKGYLPSD